MDNWGPLGSLADTLSIADALDRKIAAIAAKTGEWGDPYCHGYLEALRDVRKWIADEAPGPSWESLATDYSEPS